MIGKDRHLRGSAERLVDFAFRGSGCLHAAISVALAHRAHQYLLHLSRRKCAGVWCRSLGSVLPVERWLQESGDVFPHGGLSIHLHAAVHGGEHLESVGVDVVRSAVFVHILVAPAIQRVGFPGNRVLVILHLVPRRIVLGVWFLGHEIAPEKLAEVCSDAVIVVSHVKIELQRFCRIAHILVVGQVAGLFHLREHHVATLAAPFGIAHGVEIGRILAQSDEHGRLGDGQILWFLIKIGVGCGLDAYRIVKEIEVVEIQSDDFVLRVVALQFDGNHPLYRLLQQSLGHVRCCFGV